MSQSQLTEELHRAGLRLTSARKAVIGVLERARRHLSAEDIHRLLAAQGVHIDLSSVYRTLTLLVRLGLVRAVGPSDRHGHFELGREKQVHLVCDRCGAVIEANLRPGARPERTVAALARRHNFRLAGFTIEATGECAACRRRARPGKDGW